TPTEQPSRAIVTALLLAAAAWSFGISFAAALAVAIILGAAVIGSAVEPTESTTMGKKSRTKGNKVRDGAPADTSSAPPASSESAPPPKDAVCFICLNGDPDNEGKPIVRDCSCRGDAGFAHLSCLSQRANRKTMEVHTKGPRGDLNDIMEVWEKCPKCHQKYQRQVALGMARSFLSSVEGVAYADIPQLMGLNMLLNIMHGMDYAQDPELREEGKRAATRLISVIQSSDEGDFADMHYNIAYLTLARFSEVEGTKDGYEEALQYYKKLRQWHKSRGDESKVKYIIAAIDSVKSLRDRREMEENAASNAKIDGEDTKTSGAPDVCANCGKEGNEDAKLKKCNGCYLVKYCNVECQKAHRPKHKTECKRRAAQLKDEELFGKGHEHYLDDCPICLMPMPLGEEDCVIHFCCMKYICMGCVHRKRLVQHGRRQVDISEDACSLCRTVISKDNRINLQIIQRRVDAGDAMAREFLGGIHNEGKRGLPVDRAKAVELWKEAARLGSVSAHNKLARAYFLGNGVETSTKMVTYHWEMAAKGGHPVARDNLGCDELDFGNYNRAVKHWKISAKMGYEKSLSSILDLYKQGRATKDDYTEALIGFQKANDERKSPERDAAADMMRAMAGYVPNCSR
ncbi:hypothetical protein ACHAWF_011010, partial [Thalassiosira exigua]